MNRLTASWTGYFPIAVSYVAISPERHQTFLDIEAVGKTQRLYREKGRRAFKPLTDYRKGKGNE